MADLTYSQVDSLQCDPFQQLCSTWRKLWVVVIIYALFWSMSWVVVDAARTEYAQAHDACFTTSKMEESVMYALEAAHNKAPGKEGPLHYSAARYCEAQETRRPDTGVPLISLMMYDYVVLKRESAALRDAAASHMSNVSMSADDYWQSNWQYLHDT